MGRYSICYHGIRCTGCTNVSLPSSLILSLRLIRFCFSLYSFPRVPFRRYEAQLEKDWHHIITDSDSKLLVVSKEIIYEKVKEYPCSVGKIERILCFDAALDKEYSYQR
jgi:hypothetical protein